MSRELARKLRRDSTPPERAMWALLYPLRRNGHHFRRQVQIGPHHVDFASLDEKVVIEVDGDTHTTPAGLAADLRRDAYLSQRGFRVLRFWNGDVLGHSEGVYRTIAETLGIDFTPTPVPSPQGGGRRKPLTPAGDQGGSTL